MISQCQKKKEKEKKEEVCATAGWVRRTEVSRPRTHTCVRRAHASRRRCEVREYGLHRGWNDIDHGQHIMAAVQRRVSTPSQPDLRFPRTTDLSKVSSFTSPACQLVLFHCVEQSSSSVAILLGPLLMTGRETLVACLPLREL